MREQHTSSAMTSARGVGFDNGGCLEEDGLSYEIALAASALNVAAIAMHDKVLSGDALRDYRLVVQHVGDRLRALEEELRDIVEADHQLTLLECAYKEAASLYEAVVYDRPEGPEQRRVSQAITKLLSYRCRTLSASQRKAALFLSDDSLLDVIANSVDAAALREFLASMATQGGAA